MYKYTVIMMVFLLAGCSGTNGYRIPIIDHGHKPNLSQAKASKKTPAAKVRKAKSNKVYKAPTTKDWQAAGGQKTKNTALKTLLAEARKQMQKGHNSVAVNGLERAQRIAPKQPEIYYELARAALQTGSWKQAENFALKAAQLAPEDNKTLGLVWRLISKIRDDSGDLLGAQRARLKARRY